MTNFTSCYIVLITVDLVVFFFLGTFCSDYCSFSHTALLGEVVLYNIFYEIFTVCTSIVAEDKTGNCYKFSVWTFAVIEKCDLHL